MKLTACTTHTAPRMVQRCGDEAWHSSWNSTLAISQRSQRGAKAESRFNLRLQSALVTLEPTN